MERNAIDVFFAHRHNANSELSFGADVSLIPVLELASLALLGLGFAGVGRIRRKRG